MFEKFVQAAREFVRPSNIKKMFVAAATAVVIGNPFTPTLAHAEPDPSNEPVVYTYHLSGGEDVGIDQNNNIHFTKEQEQRVKDFMHEQAQGRDYFFLSLKEKKEFVDSYKKLFADCCKILGAGKSDFSYENAESSIERIFAEYSEAKDKEKFLEGNSEEFKGIYKRLYNFPNEYIKYHARDIDGHLIRRENILDDKELYVIHNTLYQNSFMRDGYEDTLPLFKNGDVSTIVFLDNGYDFSKISSTAKTLFEKMTGMQGLDGYLPAEYKILTHLYLIATLPYTPTP